MVGGGGKGSKLTGRRLGSLPKGTGSNPVSPNFILSYRCLSGLRGLPGEQVDVKSS